MGSVSLPAGPCPTCPYRRDVPPGVWHPEEYERLPAYDGETFEQPIGVFLCHYDDGRVCGGWLACHDVENLLAVRLAVVDGRLGPEVFDWSTDVEVFASGGEAAAHGIAEISPAAERAIERIERVRRLER